MHRASRKTKPRLSTCGIAAFRIAATIVMACAAPIRYRAYRAYPYAAYPYAYGAPYPYYRRYYAPRPFIGIGPFGFGVW